MTAVQTLPNGATLDTSALTARARRHDVTAFFRSFAVRHPDLKGPGSEAVRRVMVRIGAAAVLIGALALGFGMLGELTSQDDDKAEQLLGMGIMMGLFLVAGGVFLWVSIRNGKRRSTPKRQYRLARFAADNRLAYLPGPAFGGYLEPWADRGRLIVSRVMRAPSPEGTVEFGNYELSYATTSNGQSQFGGYCALRLDRGLPNIVLRSRRHRNPLTEAAVPARAQRLSLEGDFDRHFTLYCPRGYERDALYLFTPDVMARLIDRAGGFDVEIVDDWVFISQARDFVTLDPQRWRAVIAATGALRGKLAQWERWKDDHLSADEAAAPASTPAIRVLTDVAAPGRRLRAGSGTMWALLAVAAVIIGVMQLFRLF
ncbi:hypothetical protein PU630_07075 [Microbacterium horticulturae]|uniref:DUF3137 domain-containing protein n=1 Tax=Microbacterium horticulturae TaxID=3028316 RepID=A0ABY8C5F0_9MICO|nr:hypothetical protein [Microbacterium sp. KACC 23027]WEG10306.1 hypothetical protein PU630_07075 [Microbacterium sp. KACC 23027]